MTPATATVPVTSEGEPRRKSRRGLFDVVLMGVLMYGVYAKTPLGALGETLVHVAMGQKDHPSWFATFKGHETAVNVTTPVLVDAATSVSAVPEPVRVAAARTHVDEAALAALVAAQGTCTPTACTLTVPPKLWEAVGVMKVNGETCGVELVADGMAKVGETLGRDPQLQIEALYVGALPIQRAVDQATTSGKAAPEDAEVHAEFLSPGLRRGPLQGALTALALYRLRTLAWPADKKFRVTSPFGERIDPVNGSHSFHGGTDIGVPTGTPLLAAHNGFIKRASQDSMSGNYVVINHGLGIETVYCHMSVLDVRERERAVRSQAIGLSGATGRVTGPHVHYILRIGGKGVDAAQYGESPVRTRDVTKADLLTVPTVPVAPVKPAVPVKPGKVTPMPKPVSAATKKKLDDVISKMMSDEGLATDAPAPAPAPAPGAATPATAPAATPPATPPASEAVGALPLPGDAPSPAAPAAPSVGSE